MGPATGMTNEALVEQYSNCIKLSAENVRFIQHLLMKVIEFSHPNI